MTAVNANHQKNPQQTVFLNAKMVSNTNLPGVGPDLVYRDPWKNPYVITIDLNDDNQCKDAFYSLSKPCPVRAGKFESRIERIGQSRWHRPTISGSTAT